MRSMQISKPLFSTQRWPHFTVHFILTVCIQQRTQLTIAILTYIHPPITGSKPSASLSESSSIVAHSHRLLIKSNKLLASHQISCRYLTFFSTASTLACLTV